ncbi:S1 family peptidase [Robiginitomaculum antarcticum]|uniref:S1 family peptidase n=1 Tax=Robiginitomaculum antarcticum TaxID=437507 RepID=UPI00036D568B|nr:serine protease [Robiginitomaculum antarcticum]
MAFKPPDWSIYALVLGLIFFYAARANNEITPQQSPELGPALPDILPTDPDVLVQTKPRQSGMGTAFAIDNRGSWLTARHVVDGCDQVGLVSGPRTGVKVDSVEISKTTDTAILRTSWSRPPLTPDFTEPRRLNEPGYFFGYPQGKAGDVIGSLLGRNRMITRGRYNSREAVFAWAETRRSRGLTGSLGGLSGAPVLDKDGELIGVVTAESPRRGRVYTVVPSNMISLVPTPKRTGRTRALNLTNYGTEADSYRRDRRIAKVICLIDA